MQGPVQLGVVTQFESGWLGLESVEAPALGRNKAPGRRRLRPSHPNIQTESLPKLGA